VGGAFHGVMLYESWSQRMWWWHLHCTLTSSYSKAHPFDSVQIFMVAYFVRGEENQLHDDQKFILGYTRLINNYFYPFYEKQKEKSGFPPKKNPENKD